MSDTSNIKLICFDLNKTLIKENTWLNLNTSMGITKQEDDEMHNNFKKGELTYKDWQKKLTNLYKKRGKATRRNILKAIMKYSYREGAKDLIK